MTHASFLEVDDLTPRPSSTAILDRAAAWKADPARGPRRCSPGTGVALLFEKPSARTRVSTEMAVVALGGHPIYLRAEEVGHRHARDASRTSPAPSRRTAPIIAARVFDHAVLEAMAAAVDVPVVNLLSDRAHPCQALADLLTLREQLGTLEGRRLVFVGDGNNVAASLAFGAALSGLELTVASPPGYELDDDVVDRGPQPRRRRSSSSPTRTRR